MQTVIVAKMVVLDDKGRLLALKRSETDTRRPLEWDIPGGWAEEGEDYAEATARETKEEAGITVDPKKLQLLATKNEIRPTPEGPKNIIWLLFAGKAEGALDVKLSYEHVEFKWMTLDEAIQQFEYPLHKDFFRHIKDNDLLTG